MANSKPSNTNKKSAAIPNTRGGKSAMPVKRTSAPKIREDNREAQSAGDFFDFAPVAILSVDKDGSIRTANLYAEKLLGYSLQELAGMDVTALIPERFRENHLHKQADFFISPHTRDMSALQDLYCLHKDGSEIPVEIGINPITLNGESCALISLTDISKRKHIEQGIRDKAKELRLLYEVEQNHARELAALADMTHTALTVQSFEEVLAKLAVALQKLFEADDCYITLWDEETNKAIPQATTAKLTEAYRYIPRSTEISMTESVVRAGHALIAEDTLNSPHISPNIASRYPARSILGSPLIFREHKIGAVIIAFNTPHQFSQEEIQLAERATNHIVVSIWNSLQESEIKQQLKQQETLAKITTTLSQMETVGLPKVLDMIVISARELIPSAQQAVIHLMDKEQKFLHPEAVSGFDNYQVSTRKMRAGEGIAGLAISEERDIYIPAVSEDERFINLNPNAKFKSLLVSPIRSGNKKLGTLSIQSEKAYAFSKNEINILGELGQQAAIAIENARLYEAGQQELKERIQAEEELRASEERYRRISEDISAMICRYLEDGTLLFTNIVYAQFFGKTRQELQGTNLLALIPSDQRESVKNSYSSLTAENPYSTYETLEINAQGEKRWLQWTDRRIEMPNHIEYQSVGIDITDRKNADIERENLLKITQEQRLLAETSAEATLALVSHTETKQVLNEILTQVQRLIPGCAVNISLFENELLRPAAWRGYEGRGEEVFHSLVRETLLLPFQKKMLEKPEVLIVEDTHNEPRWLHVKGLDWIRSNISIPLTWNDQLLGLLYLDGETPGKFTQETLQRLTPLINATVVALESALLIEKTSQALKETSALYRINRGMVSVEADELLNDVVELLKNNFDYYHVQIFMLNPETGNFTLKAASGELGKKLVAAEHELQAGLGIIGYAAETRTPFFTNNVDEVVFFLFDPYLPDTKAEMSIPVMNGEKLYGILDIQQTGTKSFSERDQQLVLAIAGQLAMALHKAELYQNLQLALEQEKAVRNQLVQNERLAVMGRLLASVSHELNNPLQAIQNALFLLKEEKGISDQGHNDLEIVLAESERMASLIDRLRTTYRPPQMEDLQNINLNIIVEDVLALLTTHLRKNEISFEFHPDDNLPSIPVVSDQIRQVALNLLMNAVEAMPNGGKLTVHTQRLHENNELMLSVMDTGEGISPEILPHIFDPFVTNKKRGTGLGLTITHDIVLKHRGRITAENTPEFGACFKVWLPLTSLPAEIE